MAGDMMELYVIKCDGGYLRTVSSTGFTITSMEKASVFNDRDDPEVDVLTSQALCSCVCGICLIKLSIKESVIRKY